MDESLRSIAPSDGPSKSFEFAVNDKVQPTLKITTKTGQERLFTWDAATKRVISDNDWTYQITMPNNPAGNAGIARANSRKEREYWFNDGGHGQEISQSRDGMRTVKTWFISGELLGKTRKIEESLNGVSVVKYKPVYGEQGNILREYGGDIEIDYSDSGMPMLVKKKDKILWKPSSEQNQQSNGNSQL
jgi:hypothetical protein